MNSVRVDKLPQIESDLARIRNLYPTPEQAVRLLVDVQSAADGVVISYCVTAYSRDGKHITGSVRTYFKSELLESSVPPSTDAISTDSQP